MTIQNRIKSREAKLSGGQFKATVGTISMGMKVKRCQACKTDNPPHVTACTKCGKTNFGHEFPSKLNYFRFSGFSQENSEELRKRYGDKPTRIPVTIPGNPDEYIKIGREAWQGTPGNGYPHCINHWRYAAGAWEDSGFASRSMPDYSRRDIQCDPYTCPFSVGGPDQYQNGKMIKERTCSEKITAWFYMYDFPSLGLVLFKSGGIKTINAFQEFIPKILALGGGHWSVVPMVLEIKYVKGKYMADDNSLRGTEFPIVTLDVDIRSESGQRLSLMEASDMVRRNELPAHRLILSLPDISRRALPMPTEPVYDELVDGDHEMPIPETKTLTELSGKERLTQAPADPLVSKATIDEFMEIAKKVPPGSMTLSKALSKEFGIKINSKGKISLNIQTEKTVRAFIESCDRRIKAGDQTGGNDFGDLEPDEECLID